MARLEKRRRKTDAQLRGRNRYWTMAKINKEIKTERKERIGFRPQDYDPKTPVYEVSDKDFSGSKKEMALLSPFPRSSSSMERKVSDVLCGPPSKRDSRRRAGRNGLRGVAKSRDLKKLAFKGRV